MQGKYNTPNGEVNVVEFDPDGKKCRIEGTTEWAPESEYSGWDKIQDTEISPEEMELSERLEPEILFEQPLSELIEEKPKRGRKKKE